MQSTQNEKAQTIVNRLMHNAHLRYQREQLRADNTRGALPYSEVRGCKVRGIKLAPLLPHHFAGLRPNFWRGYLETMVYMQQ